jgi:DNA-binding transcriptional ArsR family regulator
MDRAGAVLGGGQPEECRRQPALGMSLPASMGLSRRHLTGAMPHHFDILDYANTMMRMAVTPATGELQAFKARFFKALAHPVRVRLVELLVERDRAVQELQAALTLDQSSVSQHLGVLRANHVVTARKTGATVRYALRDPLVGELLGVARRIFGNQLVGTQDMLRELKREHRRR